MYRWVGSSRVGPPDHCEDEIIISKWFKTIEDAVCDAERYSETEIKRVPFRGGG